MGLLRRIFGTTPPDERWQASGAAAYDPPPAPVAVVTAADELAKFAQLHEQGVLTDEEFAAKKAQLLALDPAAPVGGGTVVLLAVGPKKINVIKLVREATGLGLKEAKDLVESAPATIPTGPGAARGLLDELTAAGARAELR